MADLTLAEQFGNSSTISSGILTITLAEVGIDTPTPTTSQIIGALVLKRRSLMSDSSSVDPTIGCYIGEPSSGLTTRGDRQQAENAFTASLFRDVASETVTISDPDDIAV
ncbi:MAG: hypothetical protein RH949_13280 [Coleofasciculus sp. A1-SPW-01]|uniref:hypothetical protein n=1 Tax=Coleofasciculus sp. A1-SPW-01 TaxID=3070819 RepID=UPI0032F7CA43